MKYELQAPSRWDRLLCRALHMHQVERRNGTILRRCVTFGCGMLTVTEGALVKLQRKSLEAATRVLNGGGRG
jgi:hypothetical protein